MSLDLKINSLHPNLYLQSLSFAIVLTDNKTCSSVLLAGTFYFLTYESRSTIPFLVFQHGPGLPECVAIPGISDPPMEYHLHFKDCTLLIILFNYLYYTSISEQSDVVVFALILCFS